MKKIVSITSVKNESDVIESFIRYHLNIFDLMMIFFDGTTDDTYYILKKLVEEGLPIVLIEGTDQDLELTGEYNYLLKKAINEYNADIVCPLSVDQFLTSDLLNPRVILEKLQKDICYKIKFRTYIPTEFDDIENNFIPSKINHILDEDIESFYNVIFTKELYYNYDCLLSDGNCDIIYDARFKNEINVEEILDLRIAHFPLRSTEQVTFNILDNYPYYQENINYKLVGNSSLILKKLLNEGNIGIKDIMESAKKYTLENDNEESNLGFKDIEILKYPMNLDFCKDISIKYNFEINPIPRVLENYMYFLNEISDIKKTNSLNEKELNNQINELKVKFENLEKKFKESIILLGDKNIEIKLLYNVISDNKELTQKLNLLRKNYLFNSKSSQYFNENELSQMSFNFKANDSQLNALKIENNYLKSTSKLSKRFFSYFSYFYLIIKSKPSEIKLNIDLYNSLKKSDTFDIGFYLYTYPDLINSKICNLFSPELHYVCFGFKEGRLFNPSFLTTVDDKKSLIKLLENWRR